MKNSGILRNVDELGRIVIPIELRKKFGIEKGDPLEISVSGSNIMLRKFEPNCIFCGSFKKLSEYKKRLVCQKCLQQIQKSKNVEIVKENR